MPRFKPLGTAGRRTIIGLSDWFGLDTGTLETTKSFSEFGWPTMSQASYFCVFLPEYTNVAYTAYPRVARQLNNRVVIRHALGGDSTGAGGHLVIQGLRDSIHPE